MKVIGAFTFPDSPETAEAWKPGCSLYALAQHVLAVATLRIEGKWAAYVDAVPGRCHSDEVEDVLRKGCRLQEGIAEALFPQYRDLPYAK